MKLTTEIAGERQELSLQLENISGVNNDGARVSAIIDGRRYEIEARRSAPGVYILRAGNRVYECRVDKPDARGEGVDVYVGGQAYAVAVIDPKKLRAAQQRGGVHAEGAATQIVAPMPGKVVRVMVEAGADVEAGAGLIVVEAMKMQNEMKSPRAGKIVALNAEAGATVSAGDVLIVIE